MRPAYFRFSFVANLSHYFLFVLTWYYIPDDLKSVVPTYNSLEFSEIMFSLLIILIVSIVFPYKFDNPGDLLLSLSVLILVVPLLALRSGAPEFNIGTVDKSLQFILMGLIVSRVFSLSSSKKTRVIRKMVSDAKLETACLILTWASIVSLIFVVSIAGISALSLDYTNLYSRRFYVRYVYGTSVISYLTSTLNTFLLPSLTALGLYLKRRSAVFVSVFGIFSLFALDGTRSAFLRLSIIILLYFVLTKRNRIEGSRVFYSYALCAFFSLAFIAQTIRETQIGASLYDLMIRRILFAPARITTNYIDFVDNFGITNFSQSLVLAKLLDQDFVPISFVLGSLYQGSSHNNLSVNVWANAYISGGVLALLMISILLGFIIKIFDSASKNLADSLRIPLFGTTLITYLEQNFFTAILSGGVLISLLFALYLSKTKLVIT